MNLKNLVALEVSEYNLGGLDILDKLALIREDETGIRCCYLIRNWTLIPSDFFAKEKSLGNLICNTLSF
jgi:hypothetical protein